MGRRPSRIDLMAKGMFDVECPCCQAILKVDPETRAVIAHTIPEKPPAIEDLAAEVAKLKGEGARREELFRKQFEAEKSHGKVDRKSTRLNSSHVERSYAVFCLKKKKRLAARARCCAQLLTD